jgi:soluble lytic murein transglycosylase-like protein
MLLMLLLALIRPAQAWCWSAAADRYHIDPLLLYSIAKVESGLNPQATGRNHDGSYDIGLMQINSSHLTELSRFGITESRLRSEPCTAVMAGAWILARFVRQLGYGWMAVGAYNAGSDPRRDALRQCYAMQVWMYYQRLVQLREQYRHARMQALAYREH